MTSLISLQRAGRGMAVPVAAVAVAVVLSEP